MNEQQLISRCKKGDRKALEEIISLYYMPLNRYFYSLCKDVHISQDLTHETVVKLIKNIDKYKALFGAKFSTWLFRIAYNTYIDHVRKFSLQLNEPLENYFHSLATDDHVHTEVSRKLDMEELSRVMGNLPPEMKSLIALRYLNELSYEDIGQIMGMTSKTVKWKLHNAMDKLKKLISNQNGGDRHYEF
ncbi:MAG: RNA polymerase sigma factor [Clostridia bacterium]|nr:RNA polymerase sigma factor [Clostridia bacterium]